MSKERQLNNSVAAEDNLGVLIKEIHKANIWDANEYGNIRQINKFKFACVLIMTLS